MRLAAVLAALLLSLAACGDDDTPIDAGGPTDDATDETTDDTTDGTTTEPTGGDHGNGTQPPLGGGPYPIATLEITYSHPDADAVSYTISCLGDTATITPAVDGLNDQSACARLADPEVQALLVEGPPQDRICTEIYGGPDEAVVTGTIDDRAVNTTITREDGCGIDDWDNILAGVLPTAIGVT